MISVSAKQRRRDAALITLIIAGLATVILVSRNLDAHRSPADTNADEERLYFSTGAARRLSVGFDGLMADWYWMRSLQYVGHKIMSVPDNVPIDDLGALNLKLLAPLLDTATTLDPQFMEAYEYAAVVLPAINVDDAIRITRKGIAANPNAWLLYHQLGYIYWQRGEFETASELYGAGAATPDAPQWMQAMKARMAAEGGSRATAREIYTRMYEGSKDEQIREMARRRLMQLDSWDQRDTLRHLLTAYKIRNGHCLSSWKEVAAALQALHVRMNEAGLPVDPSGVPYRLIKDGCDVDLDPKSEVPAR